MSGPVTDATAMEDVERLEDLYEGLRAGTRLWWEVMPDLTCTDKTGAAVDEVWQQLCRARRNLPRN